MSANVEKMQQEDDKRFELEKQLHEQYAINNNAHTASFISFVAALFVLFGAFGYVYANSSINFAVECIPMVGNVYTLDVYFLLSIVVSGILCFLSCLSLQIGYAQRRDQYVIHKIRQNYKCKINYKDPKEKNRRDFIPDYYNHFFWLFVASQIFVVATSATKIAMNICSNKDNGWASWGFLVTICFLFQAIGIWLSFKRKQKLYKKYCDLIKKQFMKGKEYTSYKVLFHNTKNASWCVEFDETDMDSEAKAVFNPIEYKDIFGKLKKDMPQHKQRLSVVCIANDNRKIYRKFQAHSVSGLGNDCIGLSPNAWMELCLEDKANQVVSVQKSWWFPYFWHHSNSATRVSFRIGLIALMFTIVGCVLTIVI